MSLDSATRDRNTGQSRAVEVELCDCPRGYRGPSCEECEAGYTRIEDGEFFGVCEPCNCNGFSSECDPDTGHCMVSSRSLLKNGGDQIPWSVGHIYKSARPTVFYMVQKYYTC